MDIENPAAAQAHALSPMVRELRLAPIPPAVAGVLLVRHHYLHAMPGATALCLGVFHGATLRGALTLGAGPLNVHRLVAGAERADCLVLTRLWLDDRLPRNSESRTLGLLRRQLRAHTRVRFLVSFADPAAGHVGLIYQAAGWTYLGLSQATPLYDLGDAVPRHSRSVGQVLGTRSIRHLMAASVSVRLVPQSRKHRYVMVIDPTWASRLTVPALPYPKNAQDATIARDQQGAGAPA